MLATFVIGAIVGAVGCCVTCGIAFDAIVLIELRHNEQDEIITTTSGASQ